MLQKLSFLLFFNIYSINIHAKCESCSSFIRHLSLRSCLSFLHFQNGMMEEQAGAPSVLTEDEHKIRVDSLKALCRCADVKKELKNVWFIII